MKLKINSIIQEAAKVKVKMWLVALEMANKGLKMISKKEGVNNPNFLSICPAKTEVLDDT